MKNGIILACLLFAAPLMAAETPVHLVPAIHSALKGVSGPMSRVAKKLARRLDGEADKHRAGTIERLLKPVQTKGLPALPEVLATHSDRANRKADGLIEAYAQAFEERRPLKDAITGIENFIVEDHPYLSSGREAILKAALRDSPKQAAARHRRRRHLIERARAVAEAMAGAKNAPPAPDPAALTGQDRHTMGKTARSLARFVLSDEISAAGRDRELRKMAEELELVAQGASLHGDDPAVHDTLYRDAARLVREYLKAIAHEDDENGNFLRERALTFQRILVKSR